MAGEIQWGSVWLRNRRVAGASNWNLGGGRRGLSERRGRNGSSRLSLEVRGVSVGAEWTLLR